MQYPMSHDSKNMRLITEGSDEDDLSDLRDDAIDFRWRKDSDERQSHVCNDESRVILVDSLVLSMEKNYKKNPKVVLKKLTKVDIAKFQVNDERNGVIGHELNCKVARVDYCGKMGDGSSIVQHTSCTAEKHIATKDSECKKDADPSEKSDLGETAVDRDIGSDSEDIFNALHSEKQGQVNRKPRPTAVCDEDILKESSACNGFCEDESDTKKNAALDMNRTARLTLTRLTQQEISNYTRSCKQCRNFSKFSEKHRSRNVINRTETSCCDEKNNEAVSGTASLKIRTGSQESTDFDSTDSELDSEIRERKKRRSKRKRGACNYKEKEDEIVISDDEVEDETFIISSGDNNSDSECEQDCRHPQKKRERLDKDSYSSTDTQTRHVFCKNNHENSERTRGNKPAGSRINSIIDRLKKGAKQNGEVIVIADDPAGEKKLPGGKNASDSKIPTTKPTDSRCTPSLFTAHLQTLSTPSLCGICRRSNAIIKMVEGNIDQISNKPFWKLMLELQMEDRFLSPEQAMKYANEKKLQHHITLRRLIQLKSILVAYTSEAKLMYQTRMASWKDGVNLATGATSFMESHIHASFLNSRFGLNFEGHRRARPPPSCTSFMSNYSYPVRGPFSHRARGSPFKPVFNWQRFHVPGVPL